MSDGIKEKARAQGCGERVPGEVDIGKAPNLLQTARTYASLFQILLAGVELNTGQTVIREKEESK